MTAAPLAPGPVTVRVPAKVNLELLVGPRREDGYHALSTVFHAVGLYDDVTVSVADGWGISVSGLLADAVPTDGNNLAMRAARLVESRSPPCSHGGPTTGSSPSPTTVCPPPRYMPSATGCGGVPRCPSRCPTQ